MSVLDRLGSVETGWWFGRRAVPPVLRLLAPAAAYGVDRVPPEAGAVVAANHFSGIDHPLIGSYSPRPLFFLAKAELMQIAGLGQLLGWLGVFGVRRGEGDREAVRRARELVRAGNLVCIHVEGTRQRFGHPGPLHPGALMIAMQEGVPVIPLGLDTFGWSALHNRRLCAMVWGEQMSVDDLPRNRKGYAEAGERVGAEIVRLWRQAVAACEAGLPPELPDGARRTGPNPKPVQH
ncbi:MAG TPA: lysophospholipid acyltransferase family protein [Gaiellaceae bacterium]